VEKSGLIIKPVIKLPITELRILQSDETLVVILLKDVNKAETEKKVGVRCCPPGGFIV